MAAIRTKALVLLVFTNCFCDAPILRTFWVRFFFGSSIHTPYNLFDYPALNGSQLLHLYCLSGVTWLLTFRAFSSGCHGYVCRIQCDISCSNLFFY